MHHIIIRGIERKKIFQDDRDRGGFLNRLGEIVTESATSCYTWVLMPNHAHLLLRTGTVPVQIDTFSGRSITFGVGTIHPLKPSSCRNSRKFRELAWFSYTGHSTIMGRKKRIWQDTDYVLGYFDRRVGAARRRYREYVKKGIEMERRPELVGGGLI